MTPASSSYERRQPRPRRRRPVPLPSLLAPILLLLLATGSAFVPSSTDRATYACAMSAEGVSSSNPRAGSASRPLSAEAEGGDDRPAQGSEEVLRLPEASGDASIPSIKLGESIRFEEMGPVIINADGTTRRIDNWDSMTEKEREVAWRRISKRNEERRRALLEQQQQKEADGAKGE
ncbi:hypothetical protein ACHAWF_016424 [Thalassiosira exigua]